MKTNKYVKMIGRLLLAIVIGSQINTIIASEENACFPKVGPCPTNYPNIRHDQYPIQLWISEKRLGNIAYWDCTMALKQGCRFNEKGECSNSRQNSYRFVWTRNRLVIRSYWYHNSDDYGYYTYPIITKNTEFGFEEICKSYCCNY